MYCLSVIWLHKLTYFAVSSVADFIFEHIYVPLSEKTAWLISAQSSLFFQRLTVAHALWRNTLLLYVFPLQALTLCPCFQLGGAKSPRWIFKLFTTRLTKHAANKNMKDSRHEERKGQAWVCVHPCPPCGAFIVLALSLKLLLRHC